MLRKRSKANDDLLLSMVYEDLETVGSVCIRISPESEVERLRKSSLREPEGFEERRVLG